MRFPHPVTRHPSLDIFMNILNKSIVLVLNRNWQAINIRTPQEAFCMMATNIATALEIEFEDAREALPLLEGEVRGEGEEIARINNDDPHDTNDRTLAARSIRPVTCDE